MESTSSLMPSLIEITWAEVEELEKQAEGKTPEECREILAELIRSKMAMRSQEVPNEIEGDE